MAGGGADNVLWNLKPTPESDAAYHRGADISRLSHFAGEEEGTRGSQSNTVPHVARSLRFFTRAVAAHIA